MGTRQGLLALVLLAATGVILTIVAAAAAPIALLAGTSWDN
jgi:hypothetical protein